MMNYIRKKRARKGFTLVELVVVVAIIAVLTAVAAPRFMAMTDSSKVAAVQSNIDSIKTAITMYQAQGGKLADIANSGTADWAKIGSYLNNISSSASSSDIQALFTNNPSGSTYALSGSGTATSPLTLIVTLSELGNPGKYANPTAGITVASDILTFTYKFQ